MLSFSNFLDALSETYLFEMAFERKKAKETVINLSPEIVKHLILIRCFDSPSTINHWKGELNSFIVKIERIRLKPSNNRPKSSDLYQWLVFEAAPHYNVEYIVKEIKILKRNDYKSINLKHYDAHLVLREILDILNRLSVDISDGKFESIDDYI